ncbi:hypothetical protein AN396_08045 [Candidatus Epulonipiscium fishelsonii]|uniref:Uncharacterized protein n=1 Tax=Candidatus Epulonipiscium fishelsonii TaxID=77094 RepID=A0ACC8XAH4_9FIRM|nr:hypothetical protein AN396_08045 [Epulopiscium sp. SCG-B11WGA-EpuloA1]
MIKIVTYCSGVLLCLTLIPSLIVFAGKFQTVEAMYQFDVIEVKDLISDEQKMVGILAKEIPSTYHYEAIKAQAVILRTYMQKNDLADQLEPLTINQLRELWGSDYNETYELYKNAILDTEEEVLTYDGELIEPIYHRASSGRTRDGQEIYDLEIPYLLSVVSQTDTIEKNIIYSKSEVVRILQEAYPNILINQEYIGQQIQIVEKGKSGYVNQIQFGSIIMNEDEFIKIFNLPSSHVEISENEKSLIFNVKGDGHGVGLSQNGANEFAILGANYTEILKYYFTDIEILKFIE